MKKGAVVFVMGLAALVSAASPAVAAVSGAQRVVIINTGPSGSPAPAFLSGPVTGVGTTVDTETAGTITLEGGTISVFHPVATSDNVFNPLTCLLTVDETGTYQFTSGTGAFAGIAGGGTYTTRGTVAFARGPQGCSEEPIAAVVVVRASGTTTLP